MASNFPTPMPQAGVPIVDVSTGRLTLTGFRFFLNLWNRTGGDGGSNSTNVLQAANNLSDVGNIPAARSNLGLGSAATEPASFFLQTTNNLSDLTNVPDARANLGLGTAATHDAADFLQPGTTINVTAVQVGGVQVIGAQITGWGTPTGGARGSGAAYAGQTVSATYTQTEAQQTDNAVKAVSQKLMALIADLETQGLIAT